MTILIVLEYFSGHLHAGVLSCEASREENGERERKNPPLPILLAARFASPLVSRRWNACMQPSHILSMLLNSLQFPYKLVRLAVTLRLFSHPRE